MSKVKVVYITQVIKHHNSCERACFSCCLENVRVKLLWWNCTLRSDVFKVSLLSLCLRTCRKTTRTQLSHAICQTVFTMTQSWGWKQNVLRSEKCLIRERRLLNAVFSSAADCELWWSSSVKVSDVYLIINYTVCLYHSVVTTGRQQCVCV